MARLGELLITARLLTVEQLEQALRAQVMWGARLGTILVELGFLDLDTLSNALGHQHRVPAALARHFDRVDPDLQARLPPEIAEQLACVPLRWVGPTRAVVASASPLSDSARATIAEALGIEPSRLIPAIAAELRIQYQLERVYQLRRSSRFKRSPGDTVPPFPRFELGAMPQDSEPELALEPRASPPSDAGAAPLPVPGSPHTTAAATAELPAQPSAVAAPAGPAPAGHVSLNELSLDAALDAALDDLSVDAALEELSTDEVDEQPSALEPMGAGRERRTYVRTLADAPTDTERDAERQSLGRIAIRRVAVEREAAAVTASTLVEATRAIRRASGRDTVAELTLDALLRFAPSCESASLLVVRGQAAISWKGLHRSGAPAPELAVPLDQPGLVPSAIAGHATVRAAARDLVPIDQLLLVSLGHQTGELVVVPISIAQQVMCVLAMVSTGDAAIAIATADALGAAAGAAFTRLIRDAAR